MIESDDQLQQLHDRILRKVARALGERSASIENECLCLFDMRDYGRMQCCIAEDQLVFRASGVFSNPQYHSIYLPLADPHCLQADKLIMAISRVLHRLPRPCLLTRWYGDYQFQLNGRYVHVFTLVKGSRNRCQSVLVHSIVGKNLTP